jgi:hypothetical protein
MGYGLNAYQAMVVASLLFENEKIPKNTNLENYFNDRIFIK